jgi:hypothetical protein
MEQQTNTNETQSRLIESAPSGEHGQLVYDYTLRIVGVTEYGASMEDILTGKAELPSCGLRVDIAFEGESRGMIAGTIRGVDYLNIRADGRMELDIKAELTTPEGEKIALAAGGVGIPKPNSTESLLRENVKLSTASAAYAWVNSVEIWAVGRADIATGEVHVRGYLP